MLPYDMKVLREQGYTPEMYRTAAANARAKAAEWGEQGRKQVSEDYLELAAKWDRIAEGLERIEADGAGAGSSPVR